MVQEWLKSVFSTLKTHKKKSIFFAACLGFAGNVGWNRARDAELRREYCKMAANYGSLPISATDKPRRVAVLINTWAKDGKAKGAFEKNALPLLNLAGLEVNIVEAKDAVELEQVAGALDASDADALFVVGGDGTLSRVISGMLNNNNNNKLPLGFFPGGQQNYSLKQIWRAQETEDDSWRRFLSSAPDVRWSCESAMALIRESRQTVNVFKVQAAGAEKPMYAMSHVHWGPFCNVDADKWKHWYWDGAKGRLLYLWRSIFKHFSEFEFELEWVRPCDGCRKCTEKASSRKQWRWWHIFLPPPPASKEQWTASETENPECGKVQRRTVRTTDLIAKLKPFGRPEAVVYWGPESMNRREFVSEGWRREALGPDGLSPAIASSAAAANRFSLIPTPPTQVLPENEETLKEIEFDAVVSRYSVDQHSWYFQLDLDPYKTLDCRMSVDGEKYPAQRIDVDVVPRQISLFIPFNAAIA